MLIFFLKSQPTQSDDQVLLNEKLRRIFMLKVEEAKNDKDKERAESELDKFDATIFDPVNFPLANVTYRFHHEFDAVRVGVNYAWGGPVVAKY